MFEIIRDRDRLEEIELEWNELALPTGNPLLRHDWIAASVKAFSESSDPAIVVLWEGGRIRAAAPLGLFSEGLSKRLHFIGYQLREPGWLLFQDENDLSDLVGHIFQQGFPISLARVPASGSEEKALKTTATGGIALFAQTGVTHAAVLPQTADGLEASMSTSARSSLRRKLKRAQKFGQTSFTVEHADVETVERSIDEFIRIERSGWKGREGTAIAFSSALTNFFYDYGRRASMNGHLRIYRMTIDGETVAMRLGAVAGRSLFELKIAFDERFRECSPGLLLTHETLKFAIAEGLVRHEFLGMAEDWQKQWPLEQKNQVSFRRYPIASAGAFAIGQDVYARLSDKLGNIIRRGPSRPVSADAA
jgi:CelD/BcsL family acetyltransferase involved in cellulose biosynthesis